MIFVIGTNTTRSDESCRNLCSGFIASFYLCYDSFVIKGINFVFRTYSTQLLSRINFRVSVS